MSAFPATPFPSTPFGADSGGSASLAAEWEQKWKYENLLRWSVCGVAVRVAKSQGKEIDWNRSWPRGHNNGSYYDGMIVCTDGTPLVV